MSRFRVGILLQGKYRIANRFAPCTCWWYFFGPCIYWGYKIAMGKNTCWPNYSSNTPWKINILDPKLRFGKWCSHFKWVILRWTSRQFSRVQMNKIVGRLFLTNLHRLGPKRINLLNSNHWFSLILTHWLCFRKGILKCSFVFELISLGVITRYYKLKFPGESFCRPLIQYFFRKKPSPIPWDYCFNGRLDLQGFDFCDQVTNCA